MRILDSLTSLLGVRPADPSPSDDAAWTPVVLTPRQLERLKGGAPQIFPPYLVPPQLDE